jgi:hypothetical protein
MNGQSPTSSRDERWEALHNELLRALAPFGKNDGLGEAISG